MVCVVCAPDPCMEKEGVVTRHRFFRHIHSVSGAKQIVIFTCVSSILITWSLFIHTR